MPPRRTTPGCPTAPPEASWSAAAIPAGAGEERAGLALLVEFRSVFLGIASGKPSTVCQISGGGEVATPLVMLEPRFRSRTPIGLRPPWPAVSPRHRRLCPP